MPLTSFLDSQPQAAFATRINRLDEPQRRFFLRRYNELYGQYLSNLAQNPRARFTDFLGGLDFNRDFQAFSPELRGEYPRQFRPPTRILRY